jgi:hypothetical protein
VSGAGAGGGVAATFQGFERHAREPGAPADVWGAALAGARADLSLAPTGEIVPGASEPGLSGPTPWLPAAGAAVPVPSGGPAAPVKDDSSSAIPTGGKPESLADGALGQRSAGSVDAAPSAATLAPTTAAGAAGPLDDAAPADALAALPAQLSAMLAAAGYRSAAPPAGIAHRQEILPKQRGHGDLTTQAGTRQADPAIEAAHRPKLPHAIAGALQVTLALPENLAADPTAAAALPGRHLPPAGPMVTLSRRQAAGGQANGDTTFASYGERRRVPVDLAPAVPASAIWQIDDSRTLVSVGGGGAAVAALRAAELYHLLLDQGAGLSVLRPGEGFVTWDGSPLWLSLAGIGKPARLGVLLAETRPARLEVLRLEDGDWFVEHAGGGWLAPRRRRHERMARDDSRFLLDLLYGLDAETDPGAGFAAAQSQQVLAAGLADRERSWRVREAWAAVARYWARLAAQGQPPGAIVTALTLAANVEADGTLLAQLARGALPAAGITAEMGAALAASLGRLPRTAPRGWPAKIEAGWHSSSAIARQPSMVQSMIERMAEASPDAAAGG